MGESPFKKVKFSINEEFMKEYLTCQIKKKLVNLKLKYFYCFLAGYTYLCVERRRQVIRKIRSVVENKEVSADISIRHNRHSTWEAEYFFSQMLVQHKSPQVLYPHHLCLDCQHPMKKKIKTKTIIKQVTKISQMLNIFIIWIFGKNYYDVYASGKAKKESTKREIMEKKLCKNDIKLHVVCTYKCENPNEFINLLI